MTTHNVEGWMKATDKEGFYTFEVFESLQTQLRAILKEIKPTLNGEYLVSMLVTP